MADTGARSGELYQARIPIYPRSVRGRFRNLKYAILTLAYGVYFLLPWLRWPREGAPNQAVLFDIPGREFHLFDLTVYAQDIFWLAGALIIFAWLLFFVTSALGRVFCGYFCFQTLWTDLFMLIERWVQGDRGARLRLAGRPWGLEKLTKLGLTHLLWLTAAFWTGLTFTLYWADAPVLIREFFVGEAAFAAYATAGLLTATTYVMAGLAREQVCTYMCPYARFQSVMFDRDTYVIAYRDDRGEGDRGRRKLGPGLRTREERHAAGYGDCIDCDYCVQVCPTGIDIRDGLQYQCISCGLCIDACDTVMDKLGWPRGLIGYTSEREQEEARKPSLVRLKTVGYGTGLILAVAALSWSVATRAPLDVSVTQVRQPLYVTQSDGSIRNSYEITVRNKTAEERRYRFEIAGIESAELDMGQFQEVTLDPGQSLDLRAHVHVDPARSANARDFHFRVTSLDDPQWNHERPARFYLPES